MNLTDVFRFAVLILRRGRLRHSGFDFREERNRLLRDVKVATPHAVRSTFKEFLLKNRFMRTLISEAAFVKNRMREHGGHLTSADGKLAYVRIPRAASTASCKAILRDRFPSFPLDAMTPEQLNAVADQYIVKTIAKGEDIEMFTIVRNPFSRIVSVYREFFEEKKGHFLYEDYLMGIFRRDISFREFIDIVRVIPDRLKDHHLIPQHRLLRYYDKRGIDVRAFRMEQEGTAASYLAAHGLKLEVIHESSQVYDYRSYYDRETLARVKTIYEGDIVRFGYHAVYPDLCESCCS